MSRLKIQPITFTQYKNIENFHEGLAKVRLGDYKTGKYGFIDTTGKEVVPPKYDRADSFSEGLALVKLNYQYGFIDTTGKEVVPPKYDYAENFSDGLALVTLNDNGKWGFIDTTGKEVVPPTKYVSIAACSPTKFYARETEASPWLMIEIIDAMCSVCGKPESEVKELIDGPHSSVCIDCINRAQTILQNPQNPKS